MTRDRVDTVLFVQQDCPDCVASYDKPQEIVHVYLSRHVNNIGIKLNVIVSPSMIPQFTFPETCNKVRNVNTRVKNKLTIHVATYIHVQNCAPLIPVKCWLYTHVTIDPKTTNQIHPTVLY